MTKHLSKVQKKIAKKKGKVGILHENSRDAQRLQRAVARQEKLESKTSTRARVNEPLLQRIDWLQDATRTLDSALEVAQIHELIQDYLKRHDEELAGLEASRRPGRPASAAHERLKQAVDLERREYNSGLWIPDLQDEETLARLKQWKGEWGYLSTLKYIRLARNGHLENSSFPPKGLA